MWLIEEKAINFRRDVWFNPPNLPNIKHNNEIITKRFKLIQYEEIIIGANFCQVIKIKLFIQGIPSDTLGNQKWNGAVPIFNIIVDKIITWI